MQSCHPVCQSLIQPLGLFHTPPPSCDDVIQPPAIDSSHSEPFKHLHLHAVMSSSLPVANPAIRSLLHTSTFMRRAPPSPAELATMTQCRANLISTSAEVEWSGNEGIWTLGKLVETFRKLVESYESFRHVSESLGGRQQLIPVIRSFCSISRSFYPCVGLLPI